MNVPAAAPQRRVVIALGNPLRGDDGLGPAVARRLSGALGAAQLIGGCEDAMALIDAWEGAALAVVVDAAVSGAPPGTIRRLDAGTLLESRNLARCSSHGLGLAEAVELGRVLNRLPVRLVVYSVEAQSFEPGAALSREVADAVDPIVERVRAEIAAAADS